MNNKLITLEELKNLYILGESVSDIIWNVQRSCPESPSRPKPPSYLKGYVTPAELSEYSKAIQEYEKALEDWTKIHNENVAISDQLDTVLEEFVMWAGRLQDVPEKSRQKVWDLAWSRGHSSGLYQVYSELCELVSLFD